MEVNSFAMVATFWPQTDKFWPQADEFWPQADEFRPQADEFWPTAVEYLHPAQNTPVTLLACRDCEELSLCIICTAYAKLSLCCRNSHVQKFCSKTIKCTRVVLPLNTVYGCFSCLCYPHIGPHMCIDRTECSRERCVAALLLLLSCAWQCSIRIYLASVTLIATRFAYIVLIDGCLHGMSKNLRAIVFNGTEH